MVCVSVQRCSQIGPTGKKLYWAIAMGYRMEMRPVKRDRLRAHDNGVAI